MQTTAVRPTPHTTAAAPAAAVAHFEGRLAFETDCADVHAALRDGVPGFVLLDVRSRAAFERGHIPGAEHLHYGDITAERLAVHPEGTLFIVYGAGTHCNAAQRAALRIARAGRLVKEMPGGLLGWRDEGFEVAHGSGALAPFSPSTRLADTEPRALSHLEIQHHRGWRVKVYGIVHQGETPDEELMAAACEQLLQHLPPVDRAPEPPGTAFMIVHQGQDACWALLNWWLCGAVLQSKVWCAPLLEPSALEPLPPGVHLTCLWEYRVIAHECAAWSRAIADRPGDPDLEAYLDDWLTGSV